MTSLAFRLSSAGITYQGAASVEGDIVAQRLVVLEGGKLNGSLEMLSGSAP